MDENIDLKIFRQVSAIGLVRASRKCQNNKCKKHLQTMELKFRKRNVDINEIGESEDDKTESVTLVKSKSDDTPIDNQDSDAELSFREKAIHYREKAMTEITTSQETLNVVKTALSKHANPVPCDLCGKLMKNIKGVKLHMAKKHKN
ncbi:hypothetical protein BpHYR1_052643 [Brachionus plicatilis]|uniref:C2H2-type domain-containing protein n=1 Tax=Brachionus plicatilis TaxID=10195 RepID=A0A3M7S9D5_BRAPC|nr:hypothetical protein BpHYR1_052643 [Brachionus plicatilis]